MMAFFIYNIVSVNNFGEIMNINKLFLIPFLLLAISCSSTIVDPGVENPFESQYEFENETFALEGSITYQKIGDMYISFQIETDCTEENDCQSVDIFAFHDFEENSNLTKNYESDPTSLTEILLFPVGKCSPPYSASSGTLEFQKDGVGNITGTFELFLTQSNGYQPNPAIGCSETNYQSDGTSSISYNGSFTATEALN
jgi:hypothetical protein